jgi:hypothetical protein
MKNFKIYLIATILFSTLFAACEPEEVSFDETLLYGKWKSGTVYYKYLADGTGGTWDTSDDVFEEEAQAFTWTLEFDNLTHLHIMEIGGIVPKYYTVTELTASTLKYKDDFGVTTTFTKVSN